MTIEQLAALDASDRRRIHAKAIADLEAAIVRARARAARTDALERHLAVLRATEVA